MKSMSLYHSKPRNFKPAIPFNKNMPDPSPRTCQTQFLNKKLMSQPNRLSLKAEYNQGFKTLCVAESSGTVAEIPVEEEEEWRRLRERCRERRGAVELLECLETEAIMGDDVGKEPGDYGRRARIFDKSAKVFQAMKEHRDNQHKNSEKQ